MKPQLPTNSGEEPKSFHVELGLLGEVKTAEDPPDWTSFGTEIDAGMMLVTYGRFSLY
jgi:hypothetical protein